MKKLILLLIVLLAVFTGCSQKNATAEIPSENNTKNEEVKNIKKSEGDIIEIKEKMFVAQTNEIYINKEEYLGKTIKLEGIFDEQHSNESEKTYYHVYRRSPGCCGNDGVSGFEIIWDKEYPKVNDWIEVVGTLEEYEEQGYNFLRLRLKELNVKEERGKEFVNQ